MPRGDGTGPLGQGPGTGRGMGRGQGFGQTQGSPASGSGGHCVCTKCGYKESLEAGHPCGQKTCPLCGIILTREQ
ncbi:MAG: DUF5320 domain-containing protein [Fibrobacterota bacterium]